MPSAMDREFYGNETVLRKRERSRELTQEVLAGIHRVAQLTTSISLAGGKAQTDLRKEWEKELSWLVANTAQLKKSLTSSHPFDGITSVKEWEIIEAAETLIIEMSFSQR